MKSNESILKISHVQKPYIQPTKIKIDEVKKHFINKDIPDEKFDEIREFAYIIGELLYKNWTEQNINTQKSENEESNSLHTSIYRRAS